MCVLWVLRAGGWWACEHKGKCSWSSCAASNTSNGVSEERTGGLEAWVYVSGIYEKLWGQLVDRWGITSSAYEPENADVRVKVKGRKQAEITMISSTGRVRIRCCLCLMWNIIWGVLDCHSGDTRCLKTSYWAFFTPYFLTFYRPNNKSLN